MSRLAKGASSSLAICFLTSLGCSTPRSTSSQAVSASADERPPLTHMLTFCGLRSSELRAIQWTDVDFAGGTLQIRRRADRLGKIGSTKSRAGNRDVPEAPALLAQLRAWRVSQPVEQRANGLIFPDAGGNVEDHTALYRRFCALQVACGVTEPCLGDDGKPLVGEDGKPVLRAKFGLHSLRHGCASLLIADGWNAVRVAAFLGHASAAFTLKTYAHAFKDAEGDRKALSRLEQSLLG